MRRDNDFQSFGSNDIDEGLLARGKAVSAWFLAGLQNASRREGGRVSVRSIAVKAGLNPGALNDLAHDCVRWDGTFRRPGRPTLEKVAHALGLDPNEPIRLMGYDLTPNEVRFVPERIAKLPADAQQAFAQFLEIIEVSVLSKEAHTMGELFDKLPLDQKKEVERDLRNRVRRVQNEAAND